MCDATTSYIWHDSFICETWLSCVTHTCVPQTYVKHMNVSYHTHECVTSHLWMRHVTHMNASRHTYEWVTSHLWLRHVTPMTASHHAYECVISHVWMSHVPHMDEYVRRRERERERGRERESEDAWVRKRVGEWLSDWTSVRRRVICATRLRNTTLRHALYYV